jgi:thiamine kinase-like enzyme
MNQQMDNSWVLEIIKKFSIQGIPVAINQVGSGHINDTFRISTDSPDKRGYLLQRINHHVFKDVEALMQNISIVTDHIKAKLIEERATDVVQKVMTLVPTKSDQLYFIDENSDYWRVYVLIAPAHSYDVLETEHQAREGGRAFGRFQEQLKDLDSSKLKYTIPDFCNIKYRLQNFHQALKQNVVLRKDEVMKEIEYIVQREDQMSAILKMAEQNKLPLRITHNDTKFNNILLDENDKALCVIDLDTVMPGYIAYDFGDAIRTIINHTAEDEADLDKIKLNIPLFSAYTDGYFENVRHFITPNEVKSLIEGVLLFPYMQAVRFLTDYLQGDTYYKIKHEKHNLQRTRAQLKLAFEVESHREELNDIIESMANKHQIDIL